MDKIASDYPVTFGYKAVDGVYYGPNGSVGPYHRGEDREMPIGTSVVVNGVVIGLSGTRYGGPHLHVGRFVNGLDTNPNGGGFKFNNAVVTGIGSDSTNGKFVRLEADGASWVYLHLSDNSKVKVGDIIKPGVTIMKPSQLRPDETIVRLEYQNSLLVNASATDVAWATKGFSTVDKFMRWVGASAGHQNIVSIVNIKYPAALAKIASLEKQLADAGGGYVNAGTVDGKPVFRKSQ